MIRIYILFNEKTISVTFNVFQNVSSKNKRKIYILFNENRDSPNFYVS